MTTIPSPPYKAPFCQVIPIEHRQFICASQQLGGTIGNVQESEKGEWDSQWP